MRFLLFLLASLAWAGNSWVTGNGAAIQQITNGSVPTQNGAYCIGIALNNVPTVLTNTYATPPQLLGYSYTGTALAFYAQVLNANSLTTLAIGLPNETPGPGSSMVQVPIGGNPGNAAYGWICHDTVVSGGTANDYANFWDYVGHQYFTGTQSYTSPTTNSGTGWASQGPYGVDGISVAFQRICTGHAAMAVLTKPPTTFGGCPAGTLLLNWVLGATASGGTNMPDTSGNGYNGTATAGTITVAPTTYQTVVPILKTYGAPAWTPTVTMRAGNPNQLDCTASYSQADTTNTPACFLQVLAGPAALPPWNHTATQPIIVPPVFGDYLVQLTASDSAGNSASTTADIGAVGTDSNCVVVQANPDADTIYGPMMSWGASCNPWPARDQYAMIGVNEQYTYQGCCTVPTWATAGTGTIAYKFAGVGGWGGSGTTLSGNITATTLSIPIANASALDFSGLPTTPTTIWIACDGTNGCNGGSNNEVVAICSTTGTTGAQTLTACEGGRGLDGGGLGGSGIPAGPVAHLSGDAVGQYRITGSSTLFTTDPVTQLCPTPPTGYSISPIGKIVYSTGQVQVTAGSANVTGVGTTWTSGTGVFSSQSMTIWATTASGATKRSFLGVISTVVGSASITLSQVYAANLDSGTFNYVITAYRNPVLAYTRADSSIGDNFQNSLQVCVGALQLGGMSAHDYGALDIVQMTGMNYSYSDTMIGEASIYTPMFYGAGPAARQIYLASGLTKPKQLANFLDNYAGVTYPGVDGGYVGPQNLYMGGGVNGAWASLQLDPNSLVATNPLAGTVCSGSSPAAACNLRYFQTVASSQLINQPCYADDTRDTGYQRSFVANDAKWDTGSFKTIAVSNLEAIYNTRDVGGNACKQSDNSFSNAYLTDVSAPTPNVANSGYAPINVTNGSATATDATGLGITADRCNITSSGNITLTNGSAIATGTGFVNPNAGNGGRRLIIHGTKSSATYITFFQYSWNSSTSIILNGLWPGDSGTFTQVTESTGNPTTIGLVPQTDSADYQQIWACTWVNSSTITLDRPWTGSNNTCSSWPGCAATVMNVVQSPGRTVSGYGIGGFGNQPYMIDSMAVGSTRLASNVGDSASNCGGSPCDAAWKTLSQAVATFGTNPPAYDPNTYGLQYGIGYGGCDQKIPTPTSVLASPVTEFINGTDQGNGDGCQFNIATTYAIATSRGDGVEGGGALWPAYQSGGLTQVQGDHIYGAAWSGPYTKVGYFDPQDGAGVTGSQGACNSAELAGPKYFAFCYGMAMSHQWPAARLGGVLPAVNRTIYLGVKLNAIANVTNVDVVLTAPNSATPLAPVNCTSSPCVVTADARMGNYLYTLNYKSAGGAVLATSGPLTLTVQ